MKMGSGPRNIDEAPLTERSKSSPEDNVLQNFRLILAEENYSNRPRTSHAAVITNQLSLAPERGGLARCPSRFAALLASTHCPLWLGCVTACRSIRPTEATASCSTIQSTLSICISRPGASLERQRGDVNNKACKIQPWLRTDLKYKCHPKLFQFSERVSHRAKSLFQATLRPKRI